MKNWKTIITFTYPNEAHIAKEYLAFEGIKAIIRDEMTAQVNNFYSNAIGGVKVTVNASEYQRGLEILKQGGYLSPGENSEFENIETVIIYSKTEEKLCPDCGSKNIGEVKEPSMLSLLGVLFFVGFFPFYKRHYHCFDCKKQWKFKYKK